MFQVDRQSGHYPSLSENKIWSHCCGTV